MKRFPISFERWYRVLSTAVGLPPSSSYVLVEGDEIQVRMGWAFRASFPRAAVTSVAMLDTKPISRGVHGFAGSWLVNGSGRGILSLQIQPSQRGYVMGFPIRLSRLLVSLDEPGALAAELGHRM